MLRDTIKIPAQGIALSTVGRRGKSPPKYVAKAKTKSIAFVSEKGGIHQIERAATHAYYLVQI